MRDYVSPRAGSISVAIFRKICRLLRSGTKFRALNLLIAKPISHYNKKYNPLKLLSVSYKQSTIRSATVFEHSTLILY